MAAEPAAVFFSAHGKQGFRDAGPKIAKGGKPLALLAVIIQNSG